MLELKLELMLQDLGVLVLELVVMYLALVFISVSYDAERRTCKQSSSDFLTPVRALLPLTSSLNSVTTKTKQKPQNQQR